MSPAALTESRVPVLVVGGGIVGLSASLFLHQNGVRAMLVERHAGTSIHPRARSVNARSMELFRALGIEDRVREAGAAMAPSMGMHTGTSLREVIEGKKRTEGRRKFPLSGLAAGIGPVSGTFVTQDMIEPVLLDVARERDVDLRFNTDCMEVKQDNDGVTVTLRSRVGGATSTVHADYLIAADGAGSPIRGRLQVPMTGRGTIGHLINILFHAELKSLVEGREFSLCKIEHDEVSGLFTSINNDNRWVFHLAYDPSKGQKPTDFTPERCKDLLRIALGLPDLQIEIKSILPWEASVQIAERLRHGRIFLAGDAAHQMPPWAGQGANSGIADVQNLAWKLAMVLNNHAGEALLNTYDAERLPVARVAAEASAAGVDEKGMLSMKSKSDLAIAMWKKLPIVSGHGYCYRGHGICSEDIAPLYGLTWKPWTVPSVFLSLDGRPGSRVPHTWIEDHGKRSSTLDVLGKEFVLLAGSDGSPWVRAAEAVSANSGVAIAAYCVGPRGDLVDSNCGFQTAAGISAHGAILSRPDGFIVWRQRRCQGNPQAELERALQEALCLH